MVVWFAVWDILLDLYVASHCKYSIFLNISGLLTVFLLLMQANIACELTPMFSLLFFRVADLALAVVAAALLVPVDLPWSDLST